MKDFHRVLWALALLCGLHVLLSLYYTVAGPRPQPRPPPPGSFLVRRMDGHGKSPLQDALVQLQLTSSSEMLETQDGTFPTPAPTPYVYDEANDPCRLDQHVPWDDWRRCMIETVLPPASAADAEDDEFNRFIALHGWQLPWSLESRHTAVLLEFRPWAAAMRFAVGNARDNLPVHWRIQVLGGPAACALALELFPSEVAAGKVVVTQISSFDDMAQTRVSRILTDLEGFYPRLLGDTWLFFQYDSAICSSQRHLLKEFLAQDYGWWGAPWAHWGRWPRICGNGGFSLRQREFVTTVLGISPWISQEESGNEDWHICHAAANLYPTLLRQGTRRLLPAPQEEAQRFSVESMYHPSPFGVHQFWTLMRPPNLPALRAFFDNCPEALAILPPTIVAQRPDWRVLCALVPPEGGVAGCSVDTTMPSKSNVKGRRAGLTFMGRRRREGGAGGG